LVGCFLVSRFLGFKKIGETKKWRNGETEIFSTYHFFLGAITINQSIDHDIIVINHHSLRLLASQSIKTHRR
jgi:hypothetical protein